MDVFINFLDKQFSDKLNVFLYKQYFCKTRSDKKKGNSVEILEIWMRGRAEPVL